ncbi:MAG: hypothetical protein WCO42_00715 [bacterium]
MDKALKFLVVALFVLSIAAVIFEFQLYGQRETLKGRTNKLSDYVVKIAGTVELPPATITDLAVSENIPRLIVAKEQLKQYFKMGDDGKPSTVTTGVGTMDDVLNTILNNADRQHVRLNDTRGELTQTRTTLGGTSNLLLKTEGILGSTSNLLVRTEQELADARQDIEKKKTEIEGLNGQVEAGKADIEKKAGEIAKLTEKVSDCESKIDAGKRYIEKIQKELKVCQGQFDTNSVVRGLQGQITVVNSNWNFVVIDVLPESSMIPMTDLTVQRGDQLIGKVRISEIRKDQRIAVGEVLPEFQQLMPAKGDNVFY